MVQKSWPWRCQTMFKYEKKLPYPIDIKRKDVMMAKYIITQFEPRWRIGSIP